MIMIMSNFGKMYTIGYLDDCQCAAQNIQKPVLEFTR